MADQLSKPVKTFSIGFGAEDFDELRYARLIAERFSTDHHEFQVEPDAIAIMPKLARHYGEPFADPSALPSFYLAELTGGHVTVALNGDGGDENFAGYRRYLANDLAARLAWIPLPVRRAAPRAVRALGEGKRDNTFRARVQRLARALSMEPHARYAHWLSAFTPGSQGRAFQPDFISALGGWEPVEVIADRWKGASGSSTVDTMLSVDVNTYLPDDLLVKMDIATMAHSVEARSPLLDQEVMQFAASLPSSLKLRGQTGKHLLKASLRGIVPDAVLDRPKMGFGVPLTHWFRDELRDLPSAVLLDTAARSQQYVKREAIESLIDEHQAGKADHSLSIWTLLQLEHWHREVLEAPVAGDAPASLRSGAAV
jgi:asparagine synthase (glutamine-hydrolysing)